MEENRLESCVLAVQGILGRDMTAHERNFMRSWAAVEESSDQQVVTAMLEYLARQVYTWLNSLPGTENCMPMLIQYGSFTNKQGWSTFPAAAYRMKEQTGLMRFYVVGVQTKNIIRHDVAVWAETRNPAWINLDPGVNWATINDERYAWAHPFGAHWQHYLHPEEFDGRKYADENQIKRDLRLIHYRYQYVTI